MSITLTKTRLFISQIVVCIAIWFVSFMTIADTAAVEHDNTALTAYSNWPIILFVLIGMIGFIFAMAWCVKHFGGMTFSGNREMKVVTSIPLGTRERIALIDIKGQQFLIGVTTQQISHLHSFDEAVIPYDNNKKMPKQHDFAAKLQSVLSQVKSTELSEKTGHSKNGNAS